MIECTCFTTSLIEIPSNTSGAIHAADPLLLVITVCWSQAVPKSQIFSPKPSLTNNRFGDFRSLHGRKNWHGDNYEIKNSKLDFVITILITRMSRELTCVWLASASYYANILRREHIVRPNLLHVHYGSRPDAHLFSHVEPEIKSIHAYV